LGTDFTRWFEWINVSQENTRTVMHLIAGMLYLFTENNVDVLAKRILSIFIRQAIE
jgi:hypothetical protein